MIAHGYPRLTTDFDLLVNQRHRLRWDTLIRSLGYQLKHAHPVFHMYESALAEAPPVDLMIVENETFDALNRGTRQIAYGDYMLRVPSLAHLIALKAHAEKGGGEHRQGRDLNDIVQLALINELDLESPEYQAIFEKYADARFKQRLAALRGKPGTA